MAFATIHNKDQQRHSSFAEPTEISIWLDNYDDLFSDFDPRPYSERTLSDDFLSQTKKVAKDRTGNIVRLKLLLPEAVRSKKDETIVAKRLHIHFKNKLEQLQDERKGWIRKGLQLTAAGIAMMIAASYLSFINPEKYVIHLLLILFEPAGWFMLWTGLDHLIYYSGNTRNELDFFSRMADAEIEFVTY